MEKKHINIILIAIAIIICIRICYAVYMMIFIGESAEERELENELMKILIEEVKKQI